MRKLLLALTLSAALTGVASTQGVAQTHLRIGLQDDPDVMDPTLARSFAGRIVFASLCDKLFDINERLEFVPQLATGHKTSEDGKTVTITLRPGVKFHDGQKFDAAAAKFSLERHLTTPGSFRRAEISSIASVDVVDPLTIQLNLSAPFAPLIAQLSDRAGMMVSPAAAKAAGANFSRKPVCAGPFRFVERVAQNRIVVERFADYWDKSRIFFDKVTYLPIPDSTVRLANLQAGGLDLIERLAPTDMDAVRGNPKLRLATGDSLAFQSLTLNLNNGEKSNTSFGKDPRVRHAFELAIDRNVINQVVYNGEFLVGNQWVSPVNPYYQTTLPVPARDIAKAKALLKEAGVATPLTLSLMVINAPDQRQVAEVIQSMVREAGFDVKLQATEFAASLDAAQKGDFQIYLANWSGRTDPDGNLYSFHSCKGPQNNGHYCNPEVDALLDQSRATGDPEARMKLFEQIARKVLAESQSIYLFHPKLLHAHSVKLQGYKLLPDGIVRLQGVKLN